MVEYERDHVSERENSRATVVLDVSVVVRE